MTPEEALHRLRETQRRVAAAQACLATAQAERDAALLAARDAGAPWAELARAVGMTQAGVAKALKRAASDHGAVNAPER